MKLSDFIFEYESGRRYPGICRVRTFINHKGELFAVFTDLGVKNTAGSVTNDLESIYFGLLHQGYIDKRYRIIEHYEDEPMGFWRFGKKNCGRFELVRLEENRMPVWTPCKTGDILALLETEQDEFLEKTWNHPNHIVTIEQKRMRMNPLMDYRFPEDPEVVRRRLEIEDRKQSKQELVRLVEQGAGERELLGFLRKDLSIFAEVYASPAEEYLCFSEFPIGDGGRVDFAVLSSRSRMAVTLIEIKGADFPLLVHSGGYETFSKKMEIALSQIKARAGYVYRNYHSFRKEVHRIRMETEQGKGAQDALVGPRTPLQVDPNKDVDIRYIVIGGRTGDDLKESWKRHEYETTSNPPMRMETWDSFLRRLSRR